MDRAAWLAITSSAVPRMICIGSRTYNQHSTGGQADDPEGVPRGGRGPGSPPCFHTRLITRQQVYVGNKECEMRTFILAFAATGLLIAQTPPAAFGVVRIITISPCSRPATNSR